MLSKLFHFIIFGVCGGILCSFTYVCMCMGSEGEGRYYFGRVLKRGGKLWSKVLRKTISITWVRFLIYNCLYNCVLNNVLKLKYIHISCTEKSHNWEKSVKCWVFVSQCIMKLKLLDYVTETDKLCTFIKLCKLTYIVTNSIVSFPNLFHPFIRNIF